MFCSDVHIGSTALDFLVKKKIKISKILDTLSMSSKGVGRKELYIQKHEVFTHSLAAASPLPPQTQLQK